MSPATGQFLLRSSALGAVYVPPPDPPPVYTGSSPTGRDPLFNWSSAQQGIWNQMITDNHWFWQVALSIGNLTSTPQQRYGDSGEFATFVYQATGNTTYAAKALSLVLGANWGTDANAYREEFNTWVWMVDRLWPAMSAAQRTQVMTMWKAKVNFCFAIGTPQYEGGFSLADTDPLFGYASGVIGLHYFNEPENPDYLNILTTLVDRNTGLKFGPINATGTNFQSLRNLQDYYLVNFAAGGEWMESSEYNEGTQRLALALLMIAEGLVPGSYPHLRAWAEKAAERTFYETTPDFAHAVEWGDVQANRSFVIEKKWTLPAMLTGPVASSDTFRAGIAQSMQQEIRNRNVTNLATNQLTFQALLGMNPYVTPVTLPTGRQRFLATGMRRLFVKDATSLFTMDQPPKTGAHHEVYYHSNFQLNINGEWVLTHPIGYDSNGAGGSNMGVNSVVLNGLMRGGQTRSVIWNGGADWDGMTIFNSGAYYSSGYYDPPPSFFGPGGLRRHIVFVKIGDEYCVIDNGYYDVIDARTLPKLARYRDASPADETHIGAQVAVKHHLLHCPVAPTIVGNVASWTTNGGVVVQQHDLSPTAMTIESLLATSYAVMASSKIKAAEKKYMIGTRETSEQQVTRIVKVIFCGDATKPAASYDNVLDRVTIGTRTWEFSGTGIVEV